MVLAIKRGHFYELIVHQQQGQGAGRLHGHRRNELIHKRLQRTGKRLMPCDLGERV